jgi:glycosyltransferase involved in cell wall biosynthesis
MGKMGSLLDDEHQLVTLGGLQHTPRVALLLSGDVLEDRLEPIHWSVDQFCERIPTTADLAVTEALTAQDVDVVMIAPSLRATRTEWRVHEPTGSRLVLLPAPRTYQTARRFLPNPYRYLAGSETPPASLGSKLLYHVVPYLSTPPRALARLLARERVDALVCEGYEDARFDVAVWSAHRVGIPVFGIEHGSGLHRSRLEPLIRSRSIAHATALVIHSDAEADRVRATYGVDDSKFRVAPRAIDATRWFPEPRAGTRERLDLPLDARVVVWRGGSEAVDDELATLLRMWTATRACAAGDSLRLLLVVSGDHREAVQEQTRAADPTAVVWSEDTFDQASVRQVLACADVFVTLPSARAHDREHTALEAMACGLAVVASDAGLPQPAPHAVAVSREDTGAWIETLLDLANDPVRRHRLGAAARDRVVAAPALDAVGPGLAEAIGLAPRAATVPHAAPPKSDAGRRPLVSVVTIFLDADEQFFEEAIASVFAQTYTNWELLLVDDGSTNGSSETARRYAREHPDKIRYLEHPGHENRGMSATRNLGMRHARGEYVGLLDADDIWLPEKLERQVAILEAHPEAGMVYGPTLVWYGWTGEPEDVARDANRRLGVEPDSVVRPSLLVTLFLDGAAQTPATCGMLVRRTVVDDIGGFEESFRGMYEDQAFFLKVGLHVPVFVESGSWDLYRRHPESACHVAERLGEYDPYLPHEGQRVLLDWFEAYVARQELQSPHARQALSNALRPYREGASLAG